MLSGFRSGFGLDGRLMAGQLVDSLPGRGLGVFAGKTFGGFAIAVEDRAGDRTVLLPDDGGALGSGQDEAHGTHELGPLLGDGVRNLGIAGQGVNRVVEGDIGIDEAGDVRPGNECLARLEGIGQGGARVRGCRAATALFRGEASGEAVEDGADLVEGLDARGFEGGNGEPTAAMLDQKAATLENLQGVADRLTGNAEEVGDALLGQPLAGLETARRDRRDELVVNLINERGAGLELVEHDGVRWLGRHGL